ncbi:N/A [soil metagenome]
MKSSILVDASHYRASRPTGVERYVDLLLPLLDKELRTAGVIPTYLRSEPLPHGDPLSKAEVLVIPYKRFWSNWAPRKALKMLKPDLYFTPSGIPPLRMQSKTAVTVHDLSVYQVPQAYSTMDRFRQGLVLKAASRQAQVVLTPSQFVADSVRKLWGIPFTRIVVTPLAQSTELSPESRPPQHAIPKRYLLYIGRVESKKNLETIVRSHALYRQNGGKLSLVIAGAPGYGAGALYSLVSQLPEDLVGGVKLLGYVTDPERAWLYAHATACVVPSPYEGFGIPVLEAFSAGVPVLGGDGGGVPEVLGDAGILVPPMSPAAWVDAFTAIESPSKREELSALGTKRLGRYTWKATAKATAAALLAALS